MGNGESAPDPALRHNTTAASMKSPMPDQTELEERFARVLVYRTSSDLLRRFDMSDIKNFRDTPCQLVVAPGVHVPCALHSSLRSASP
ncbi:Hypp5441 [Branchiostoma lanceolatum]|uniref:Hypp5441 protein n=1 Tax=Branchiostoma lanceolatum TaxID=7740 RepID=A0A8J9YQ56_BRALA|nr:Hypp5441 [Branchiostoma lanceolatum]